MKVHALIVIILVSFTLTSVSGVGKNAGALFSLFSQPVSSDVRPVANFTYSPTYPVVNQPVHFNDTSYEIGGSITSWEWNFNGTIVSVDTPAEANQTYTFTVGGTYTVFLTVGDAQENASSVYRVIYVRKIYTSLSLDPPEFTGGGDEVVLTATLTDEYGSRAPSALPISFYVNDSRGDNLLIGVGFTDGVGRASVVYVPQGSGSIVAVFDGTAVYDGASSNVQVLNVGVNLIPYAVLASVAIIVMSVTLMYIRRRSRKSAEEEEEASELEEEEEEK